MQNSLTKILKLIQLQMVVSFYKDLSFFRYEETMHERKAT